MSDYILTQDGKLRCVSNEELMHYGVKGMKWGVRRAEKRADNLRNKITKNSGGGFGSKKEKKRMKYDRKLDKLLRKNHAYDDFGSLSDADKEAARSRIKPSKYTKSKTPYHLMSFEQQREVDNHYSGAMFMQDYLIKYAKDGSDRKAALANKYTLAVEYERLTHEEPR